MAKKRKVARGTAQRGGNPPKHTQFRKGTSGNPRGRPKGSKNLSTYLMEAARNQSVRVINPIIVGENDNVIAGHLILSV